MVKLGNFLFHYRNGLFPLFYLFLFIPSPWIFENYWIPIIVGFVIALIGQIVRIGTIGLKYIIRGGSNRRVYAEDLVTEGIFAHCRNPLYVGNVLILIGLGVMSNSWIYNLILTPLFIFFYQAIIKAEENFLENKFGEAYDQYKKDVNRWMPSFSGLVETFKSMNFSWPRVIIREYNATFIWLCGAVLIGLKTFYYQERGELSTVLPWGTGVIIALLLLYLIARYLKKSKRLTAS